MERAALMKRGQGKSSPAWPVIGLTIGDPAGIGPEILVKALCKNHSLPEAGYILFGPAEFFQAEAKLLGLQPQISPFPGWGKMDKPGVYFFPWKSRVRPVKKGEPSAEGGRVSYKSFCRAIAEAQKGNIQAIVTSPISKLSWKLAGLPWKGHTEYLEHFYPRVIMAFWSRRLKVALFSHHLPLQLALKRVTKQNLVRFFLHLHQSLHQGFGAELEYLVAGFNPHAGEEGLLGQEEEREIIPAIAEAKANGLNISGPYPPDVVFRQALDNRRRLVVALYHDQGLIAFKLVSFAEGVNVSLGLPFIRTSPDHGTAFDIAGQRIASEKSMLAAIRLAHRLAIRSAP